jgi:hypothetical protein
MQVIPLIPRISVILGCQILAQSDFKYDRFGQFLGFCVAPQNTGI